MANSIKIHLYQEKDKDSFIDMFMNDELCQHMAGGAFDKQMEAENLFFHLLKLNNLDGNSSKSYGIYENNKHIGHFEINKNSFTKENELEIVFLLTRAYWGKGLMKQIIEDFQKEYTENFVARVLPNNSNSIKMIRKIGNVKETITNFNQTKVIKFTLNKAN